MQRRTFLAATAAAGTALSGCLGFGTRSARSPPLVTDRPDAVYRPTHTEAMAMAGMGDAPDLRVAVTYSYPERFWNVTGTRTQQTEIQGEDSVHLMAVVWHPETGVYFPDPGVSVEVLQGDDLVSQETIYPMLSQRMGLHYGGNFQLPGDGSYTARVTLPTITSRATGAFDGLFAESSTVDVDFDFAQATRDDLPYQTFDDAGAREALSPMEMGAIPRPSLPTPADMPGTHRGTAVTGDAHLAVVTLDEPPQGAGDGDGYLAVSARTPYNRMPLAMMGLAATLTRDGETVFEGPLERTLDSALHYHYGASVAAQAGDELTLSVTTPPQVARHEGYETAFLEMPTRTLTLERPR